MAGSFRDELFSTIRAATCASLSINENYYNFASRVVPYAGAQFIANLASQYFGAAYRLLCNEEPPAQPSPPFEGGQCNTVYSLGVLMYNCVPSGCGNDGPFAIGNYTGPITSVTGGYNPAEGWGVYITANGIEVFSQLSSAGPDDYTSFTVQEVYLARIDGLPDDCGNPPTPVPPGNPGYNESDETFTYTDNNSVDIDVDINFRFGSPTITPIGELNIPIRIDIGDIGISFGGNINMNTGDITLNFNNQNYSRNGSPTPDSFGSDDDIPPVPPSVPEPFSPPSLEDDEPETTRIIRAVIVTSSYSDGSNTVIGQLDNPDIYSPNLGYINFYCAVSGNTAWTADIPVKNLRQIIECPFEGGAIAVAGTPRVGVTWELTPVYAYQEDVVEFAL